jgi:hypothetical protein
MIQSRTTLNSPLKDEDVKYLLKIFDHVGYLSAHLDIFITHGLIDADLYQRVSREIDNLKLEFDYIFVMGQIYYSRIVSQGEEETSTSTLQDLSDKLLDYLTELIKLNKKEFELNLKHLKLFNSLSELANRNAFENILDGLHRAFNSNEPGNYKNIIDNKYHSEIEALIELFETRNKLLKHQEVVTKFKDSQNEFVFENEYNNNISLSIPIVKSFSDWVGEARSKALVQKIKETPDIYGLNEVIETINRKWLTSFKAVETGIPALSELLNQVEQEINKNQIGSKDNCFFEKRVKAELTEQIKSLKQKSKSQNFHGWGSGLLGKAVNSKNIQELTTIYYAEEFQTRKAEYPNLDEKILNERLETITTYRNQKKWTYVLKDILLAIQKIYNKDYVSIHFVMLIDNFKLKLGNLKLLKKSENQLSNKNNKTLSSLVFGIQYYEYLINIIMQLKQLYDTKLTFNEDWSVNLREIIDFEIKVENQFKINLTLIKSNPIKTFVFEVENEENFKLLKAKLLTLELTITKYLLYFKVDNERHVGNELNVFIEDQPISGSHDFYFLKLRNSAIFNNISKNF